MPPPLSIFEGGQGSDCLIMVNLGKLCCPHCSRDARGVHQIGALIPGGAVVTVGDPYRGTVREAGCLGEDHGSGRLVLSNSRRSEGNLCPLCASLEFAHHLYHLPIIDAGRIPFDAIGGLTQAASNLSLSHTANELLPWGLIIATVLNTRLSGIVQKLIVANPEGGIPGFVVGPTVVGVLHGLVRLVDVISLDGQGSPATIPCGSLPTVPLHAAAVDLLIIEAIIEIEIEDLAWHVLNLGEQGVGFHGSSRLVDVLSLQGQATMADSMWTVCRVTSTQSYPSSTFIRSAQASAADLQSNRGGQTLSAPS